MCALSSRPCSSSHRHAHGASASGPAPALPPCSWGACWLGDQLWRELQFDSFFAARLGCSREGTDWEKVLRLLTLCRLLSPGSEWRLHRHWIATTACADLLGADERLAQDDTLSRGLDGFNGWFTVLGPA
jgi:hypothetical protein